jgi:hypothetical protein
MFRSLMLCVLAVSATQALAAQPQRSSVDPQLQTIISQGMCCKSSDPRLAKVFELLEDKIVETRISIGDGADINRPCLAQAMRELDGSEALISRARKVAGNHGMAVKAVKAAGWGIAGAQSLIEHDRTNTCKRKL